MKQFFWLVAIALVLPTIAVMLEEAIALSTGLPETVLGKKGDRFPRFNFPK
jgi:uncharacterized membrane protein YqaE (UPF0057 family)